MRRRAGASARRSRAPRQRLHQGAIALCAAVTWGASRVCAGHSSDESTSARSKRRASEAACPGARGGARSGAMAVAGGWPAVRPERLGWPPRPRHRSALSPWRKRAMLGTARRGLDPRAPPEPAYRGVEDPGHRGGAGSSGHERALPAPDQAVGPTASGEDHLVQPAGHSTVRAPASRPSSISATPWAIAAGSRSSVLEGEMRVGIPESTVAEQWVAAVD